MHKNKKSTKKTGEKNDTFTKNGQENDSGKNSSYMIPGFRKQVSELQQL